MKLDIRKAFDSIWQHSLGELVAARVGGVPSARCPFPTNGGGMPWEAMLWLSILETGSPNVAIFRYATQSLQFHKQMGSDKDPRTHPTFSVPSSPEISRKLSILCPSKGRTRKEDPDPPAPGDPSLTTLTFGTRTAITFRGYSTCLRRSLQRMGLHIHPTKILFSKPTGGGHFHHWSGNGGMRTPQHCNCGAWLADYLC